MRWKLSLSDAPRGWSVFCQTSTYKGSVKVPRFVLAKITPLFAGGEKCEFAVQAISFMASLSGFEGGKEAADHK